MKKTLLNQKEWNELMMEMPFGMASKPRSKEEAMTLPPCCLKTKARTEDRRRADFGKLLKYDIAEVIVVSYMDRATDHADKSLCKWVGDRHQYEEMWDCD